MYYRFFSVIDIVVSAVDSLYYLSFYCCFYTVCILSFFDLTRRPDPVQFSPWPTLRIYCVFSIVQLNCVLEITVSIRREVVTEHKSVCICLTHARAIVQAFNGCELVSCGTRACVQFFYWCKLTYKLTISVQKTLLHNNPRRKKSVFIFFFKFLSRYLPLPFKHCFIFANFSH